MHLSFHLVKIGRVAPRCKLSHALLICHPVVLKLRGRAVHPLARRQIAIRATNSVADADLNLRRMTSSTRGCETEHPANE